MHDALQLERLGVPATVVITDPFQGLAARVAEGLVAPGYHALVVPHPIATRDEETVRTVAHALGRAAWTQLAESRTALR